MSLELPQAAVQLPSIHYQPSLSESASSVQTTFWTDQHHLPYCLTLDQFPDPAFQYEPRRFLTHVL